MSVRQKLGVILESGSKIEFKKNCFTKKWSSLLIFFDKIFFEKIRLIFDIEN